MLCAGPAAFMLGNEGQGLSPKQMALCDRFVYIPQYGVGTASLNVAVAASIVLHHFSVWAGVWVGVWGRGRGVRGWPVWWLCWYCVGYGCVGKVV